MNKTDNGWEEYKKLILHVQETNSRYIKRLETRDLARAEATAKFAKEFAEFKGIVGVKLDRLEKIVYGAAAVASASLVAAVLDLITT